MRKLLIGLTSLLVAAAPAIAVPIGPAPLVAVPEPATYAIAGVVAIAGIVLVRKWRSGKKKI